LGEPRAAASQAGSRDLPPPTPHRLCSAANTDDGEGGRGYGWLGLGSEVALLSLVGSDKMGPKPTCPSC
jgi:hypothetical protein